MQSVIITKNNKYSKLIDRLARKLASKNYNVRVEKKIPVKTDCVVFFDFPDSFERNRLKDLNSKYLIVLPASNLTNKQKNTLKTEPVYFLHNDYNKDTKQLAKEIAICLFAKRTRIENITKSQNLKKIARAENFKKSIKPELDNIVEKKPHINIDIKSNFAKRAIFSLMPLVLITALIFYPYLLIKQTKESFAKIFSALSNADLQEAQTKNKQAKKNLTRLTGVYRFFSPFVANISPKEDKGIKTLIAAGYSTIDFIDTTTQAMSRGKKIAVDILSYKAVDIQTESDYLLAQTRLLNQKLSELEIYINVLKETNAKTTRVIVDALNRQEEILSSAKSSLFLAEQILPVLPDLMSAQGRKKYLLVFANNMELRPVGGFIGSVGFARFENGKMLPVNIEDIYALDGQLEGQIEPPEPIRKYLGEENWYLRDANWNPDFTRSAGQINWFLEKETGSGADGVILLDIEFVKELLLSLDGVYVPDLNKIVTADSLYLEAQQAAENNFFPGATNKKDILGSIANSILVDLSTRKTLPIAKIINSVNKSLVEKHLLVNFKKQNLQNAFDKLGWTGRLLQPECQTEISKKDACAPDYLMFVEANLGINKVNYFVERTAGLTVSFNKNRLQRLLTLKLTNNSAASEFPGGSYKNYLRVLVPPDVVLDSVRIDNKNLSLEEIEQTQIIPYKSWGLLVKVPPAREKTLEFSYSSPLQTNKAFQYEILVQKQAGLASLPLLFQINPPTGKILGAANFKQQVAKQNSLIYNTTLSTDKIFKIKIL